MPRYLLRYRVQTCLTHSEDLAVTFDGHKALLLFGQKPPSGGGVLAEIEAEGANNREAQRVAASFVLPQILDSLAFCTETPLLLEHCEFVLKDERGSPKRRVIHVAKRNVPALVELDAQSQVEIQTLLERNEHLSLPLCWYRYALYRKLALDRFLFQWLAFESLAGEAQVQIPCPNCGHVNSHSGSDKKKAYELYLRADPGMSRKTFNQEVWGRMRNAVFHGNHYPVPAFLSELNALNENLRRASETEISERGELGNRQRPRQNLESIYYFHNFIEWTTTKAESTFAFDFPLKKMTAMVEHGLSGTAGTNFPESSGFSILNYEPDSREW